MPQRRKPVVTSHRVSQDQTTQHKFQRPLKELCCVNPDCLDAGKRGTGNLTIRRGKGTPRWRILRCRTCKTEFSERKGTPLWGTRMPPEKAEAIANHLKEACGIRRTARLTNASKDGVTSIAIRLGLHAHALHNKRVKYLEVNEAQFDEKWSFVNKKQEHCDSSNPADNNKGDQWDHTAIDVESRLVVSLAVGKRTSEKTKEVIGDFAHRSRHIPPPLMTSDNCNNYAKVLLEEYGKTIVPERTGSPGRPKNPYKEWPSGSVYATVNKSYKQGAVSEKKCTIKLGSEEDLSAALEQSKSSGTINTSFVERQNGTDRNYNSRKVRKTYAFSKDLVIHIAVSWWVMFCYNFHHLHGGLRQQLADGTFLNQTPAMVAGLTERPLTITDIITTQVVGFTPTSRPKADDFSLLRHTSGPAP